MPCRTVPRRRGNPYAQKSHLHKRMEVYFKSMYIHTLWTCINIGVYPSEESYAFSDSNINYHPFTEGKYFPSILPILWPFGGLTAQATGASVVQCSLTVRLCARLGFSPPPILLILIINTKRYLWFSPRRDYNIMLVCIISINADKGDWKGVHCSQTIQEEDRGRERGEGRAGP